MRKIIFLLIGLLMVSGAWAQTSKSSSKKKKDAEEAVVMEVNKIDDNNYLLTPQKPKKKRSQQKQTKVTEDTSYASRLEAYIGFDKGNAYYTKGGLNTLDSIYLMCFNTKNNRFYKMTIIGYDDGEELNETNAALARNRAVMVFKYFASREETEYIIKRTPSTYVHSCEGEVNYYIKYKMPFDFSWVNLADKASGERVENGINLEGKVHIIIEDDPEDCLGDFYNYDWPAQDTVLSGNYAQVNIPKGCLEYIHHTKDTIVYTCPIEYKEVLSFEQLANHYSMIPHKKQYIVNAGYVVISPEHKPDYSSCPNRDEVEPEIRIAIPIEKHQQEAGLKFYGKTFKPNGEVVYKAISTKKNKDKDTKDVTLECYITPFQFDTIYLGKKIEENEMSDYFYPAKEGEPGCFEAMGGWLKPYKLNKKGEYVIKDKMSMVLRKPNGAWAPEQ